MAFVLTTNARAPAEQTYRVILKNFLRNEFPPARPAGPATKFGPRVLPPHLGEMGAEVRYHIARTEPWLRNGWQIVARRPAFYPEGTAIESPEYFREVDALFKKYGLISGYNGFCTTPVEYGNFEVTQQVDGKAGKLVIALSDLTKVMIQSEAEIVLRTLFQEWFECEGRPISDYDRHVLSFNDTAKGNWEYHCAAALRPSYLPPAFENPPEPAPPHVGVQMRRIEDGQPQPRNSDAVFMMETAGAIARHMSLPLLVYGHPGGCFIPQDAKTTWDPQRPKGSLARELGYLRSCRLMLGPDSGWTDLMAWLEVPTLLEKQCSPGEFEPLRAGFRPRIQLVERDRPIEGQVDALLAADGPVLPETPARHFIDTNVFPWEP